MSLNDEINISIQHASVAAELERQFCDDLKPLRNWTCEAGAAARRQSELGNTLPS
jgi:hypothetical protein